MKGIVWVVLGVMGSANLWAQPVSAGKGPVVVNQVLAVVGGTRVITEHDIPQNTDNRLGYLAKLIEEALIIHDARTSKKFVIPAGLGEQELARHMRSEKKKRGDYSRSDLIRELQQDGIALEQFEERLIDQVLLRAALKPIRNSIQVSPRAVSEAAKNGLKQLDLGPYVDFLALKIPASEDGINEAKVKTLIDGIKTADDFKKMAKKRKVAGGVEKGRVFIEKEDTHYVGADVSTTLFLIEEGKAGFHPSSETYYLMYVTERGEQQKPDLNDPRDREMIRRVLSGRQYNDRLQLKIQRLKQEINVYRPGIDNN